MPACTKRASGPTISERCVSEGDDVVFGLALDIDSDALDIERGVPAFSHDRF